MNRATVSLKPGTTAHGRERKRLRAWLLEHNSHGLTYELHFMPDDDKPEVNEWIRAPWLDEPKRLAGDRRMGEREVLAPGYTEDCRIDVEMTSEGDLYFYRGDKPEITLHLHGVEARHLRDLLVSWCKSPPPEPVK